MDLSVLLNGEALGALQRDFGLHGWKMTLAALVTAVHRLSHNMDPDLLREIFQELDTNGDGVLPWTDFSSRLVELASIYYQELQEQVR